MEPISAVVEEPAQADDEEGGDHRAEFTDEAQADARASRERSAPKRTRV